MNNLKKRIFLKIIKEYRKANEVRQSWREQFGEIYWQPFKQAIRSGPFWYIQLLNYFTVFRIYTIGTVGALGTQYIFIEIKQMLDSSYSAEISEQLFKMVLNTFSAVFQIWLLWVVMKSIFRFIVQRIEFTKAFSPSVRVFINYTLLYYYQVFSFNAYDYRTADLQTFVYPLINLFLFSLNIWLIRRRISSKIFPTRSFKFITVELDTFDSLIAVVDRWQPFIQLCSFGETNAKDKEVDRLDQSGQVISMEYHAVVKLRYSPIKMDLQWVVPTRIAYIAKKWKEERTINEG